MKLNDLQQTLCALAGLKSFLQPALLTIKRHLRDEELKFTVSNHIIILVASFLEEWPQFERLGKDDPNLRQTAIIASPAVRRIKKWKDLRKLRSTALAHPLREKDGGNLTNLEEFYKIGTAPNAYEESILLAECAVYAISTALVRHSKEHTEALAIVYREGPHEIPNIGITSLKEFVSEITEIRQSIIAEDPSLEVAFGPFQPL